MRLPLQLVSLLSLKLAVPATRITGTFQNNSVDGMSSALMGPGQAVWVEERELCSRSPNLGLCPLEQRWGSVDGRVCVQVHFPAYNSCLLETPSCKLNPVFLVS